MSLRRYFMVIAVVLLTVHVSHAQRSNRRVLEARKVQLKKDIVYINALLSNNVRKEKNLLNDVRDLNTKIRKHDELIGTITLESKALVHEISINKKDIRSLEKELKYLKEDYAAMIVKSYKSKSQQSRLMFLLSSDDFNQGYKRFQYMKQYTAFRKKQGEEISLKTTKLLHLNDTLKDKNKDKELLIKDKKSLQHKIENQKKQREVLIGKVQQKEDKYRTQIRGFEKRQAQIAAQIDKIIRDAIKRSNKGSAKGTKSTGFKLTPENQKLASQFIANKGKLPWPVIKGYLTMRFGTQPHPVVKSTTIQSNGVRIATAKGAKARAVFKGSVLEILVMSGNRKAVLVQHGNYISIYKNLATVSVKKGDKLTTKQTIGTVHTDKISGKTILWFVLSKELKTVNPAHWINKM
ncbi:MAG: peptidase M23 [Flavobacteriaceae bacterium]|nr:MAG: peptidase M23 [Flavobacteriaceae bacterium]